MAGLAGGAKRLQRLARRLRILLGGDGDQILCRVVMRLGSVLEPMHNYFRHRSPMLNAMLRAISPLLGFEELDPSLQAARRPAPGRVQA